MKHHSVRLEYSSPAEWTKISDGRIFGQPAVKIIIELPPDNLNAKDAFYATRTLFVDVLEDLEHYLSPPR